MVYDISFDMQPLSKVLNEFRDIAGRNVWDRRRESVEQQFSRLTAAGWLWHLSRPMDLAFWKSVRRAEGRDLPSTWDDELTIHLPRFFIFLYTAVATHRKLGTVGQTSLKGALRDAAGSNRDGLGPVAHELVTARDLMLRGFDVELVDLEQGGRGGRRTCDFLLRHDGRNVAEAECKHVSGDLGRPIHAKEAHALADRLADWLDGSNGARVASGLRSKLVLRGRLGADKDEQAALYEFVGKSLLAGQAVNGGPPGAHVKIGRDEKAWRTTKPRRSMMARKRGAVFDVTWAGRAEESYGFEYFNASAGKRVALSVESERMDKPRDSLRRVIERTVGGSKAQFSKALPGLLFCHLRHATSRDLLSWKRRNFLDGSVWQDLPRWEHLHSLVFTAPGEVKVEPVGNGPLRQTVETVFGYQLSNPHWMGGDASLLADLGTPLKWPNA
ncbi:MAG: hypothetical protein OXC69_08715 [Candidatus Tectomicrobia bacterium]|nr:hypothetical protein [Candidatus Tectomicrobia bacterium]